MRLDAEVSGERIAGSSAVPLRAYHGRARAQHYAPLPPSRRCIAHVDTLCAARAGKITHVECDVSIGAEVKPDAIANERATSGALSARRIAPPGDRLRKTRRFRRSLRTAHNCNTWSCISSLTVTDAQNEEIAAPDRSPGNCVLRAAGLRIPCLKVQG